jgi:hypothetical protein
MTMKSRTNLSIIGGIAWSEAVTSEVVDINSASYQIKFHKAKPECDPPAGTVVLFAREGQGVFWIVPVNPESPRLGPFRRRS